MGESVALEGEFWASAFFSRPRSTSSHGKPGQAGQALRDSIMSRDVPRTNVLG
jgi:hypothetical protein